MQGNYIKTGNTAQGLFNYAAMPGYQEQEYQLVWALPEALRDKVRKCRFAFHEKYPHPFGMPMQVVLPLVKFRQRLLLEERVRHSIFQLASGWRPFQITLKNFASVPSHSIYIPVASRAGSSSSEGLHRVNKDLKSIQTVLKLDKEHAPFFFNDLKLIVASRLPSAIFDAAWKEYAHRSFSAQFIADACLLIKRSPGDVNWKIVQRFELRDLPVGVTQQSLFEA
jgi:2'-5' RNA ligase